jgi:hypothetical protein
MSHPAAVAIKSAATNAIWYNDAAIIVTENIGMIGQTTHGAAGSAGAAGTGSAMRMRRCRARRRARLRCFTIEVHRAEIDTLVHRGLLRADERAVVDALSQYIEQTLGSAL